MPIDKRIIDRFLDEQPPYVPDFKGMSESEILRLIYQTTGTHYNPSKTIPRKHQLEGIGFAIYCQRSLLFYDMRLGKTLCALSWAEHMRRAKLWHNKGIVIAHSPIGLDIWETQGEKHSTLQIRCVRRGTRKWDQVDNLLNAVESDCDLVVTSWPGIQALFTERRISRKKGVPKFYPVTDLIEEAANLFSLAIMDEIHYCQNHNSLRFATASQLVQRCPMRLGLTGTPVGRNEMRIWPQVALVDNGILLGKTYYFFEVAFGVRNKSAWSKHDYKLDRRKRRIFDERLRSIALFYDRSEVHSFEPLRGDAVIRMSDEQREAYNDTLDGIIKIEQRGKVVGEKVLENNFHRMRQISSGWLQFNDDYGQKQIMHFPGGKLAWLEDLLLDYPSELQTVIFHTYTHTGELICKLLRKHNISHGWLYGGTRDRDTVVRDFQESKTKILVANAEVGGVGIELSKADYELFFESPTSPRSRKQAEARPMSQERGDRTLIIDDLISAPIDRKVLGFIKEGKDVMDELRRGGAAVLKNLRI